MSWNLRMSGAVCWALLIALSGCASTAEPANKPTESFSQIVIDDSGQEIRVNVTNETGAVVGHVLNDAGFGLPNARVTVLGADHGAATNSTGWFEVLDVRPGKRLVRAEHESYRAAESEVVVQAGQAQRLTITLVPSVDGDAGYRPHIHDYWAGRTEVVVVDNDFDWHSQRSPGPYGQVNQQTRVVTSLHQVPCVLPNGKSVHGFASPFWFTDAAQIVWPGTAQIELKASWGPGTYVGAETIGIAWRPANSSMFTLSPPLRNGQSYSIPVVAEMWDSGHHPFTLWEFYVCAAGKGESNAAGGQQVVGRVFTGKYHVIGTLKHGHPIFVDPPHPRFWSDTNEIVVFDGWRNITCNDFCWTSQLSGRPSDPHLFIVRPSDGSIIPPGTAHLLVKISWTDSAPSAGHKPFGISYSGAHIPPRLKSSLAAYSIAEPIDRSTSARAYNITLKPGESDSFYQKLSNWAFLLGYEGEESDPGYLHTCGCNISIRLSIQAVRGPV